MKLEAKHLAPYLPYDLKVQHTAYIEFGKSVEKIDLLEGIYKDCCTFNLGSDWYFNTDENECSIKPILRKISSITDQERKELFKLVFGRAFPDNGGQVFIDKKSVLQEPRWVLSSGVDRLGILQNGEVWYDCDLSPYKFNQHLITLFYLERHFDLFGLIDAGLAIEKLP